MDKDKIIKALECCCESDSFDESNCKDCPAECMSGYMSIPFIQQVLALLKEDCHNCKLECLLQKYDELKEKYDALLKEQVPLEPYACEGDMKCGNGCEIVGYIRESDGKIERLANYCPYCGRPVKWD